MDFKVKVIGLEALKRKLDGDFLIQPEMEKVGESLGTRVDRPRRTLGFQRNPLAIEHTPLASANGVLAEIASPLNSPRTRGTAWLRFVTGLVRGSFMRNQLKSAAKRMEERFASGAGD